MRLILLLALIPVSGWAADFSDPDWPCIQRKIPNLSVGQMWSGPIIPEADMKNWRSDADVAALAPALAIRRTSEDEARQLIANFAAAHGDDKAAKLSRLFAGVFALINRERSQIMSGIGRYARTQTTLTEGIEESQNKLTDLLAIQDPDFDTQDRIEELEDKIQWDTRIYKDRQHSLNYVCETPVILERRAFFIAQTIMDHMG